MHFSSQRFVRLLLLAAGIWLGLRFLLPISLPFLLAAALSLAAEPLVGSLKRYLHLPRGAASAVGVTLSLLITVLLFLSICALLLRELSTLADVLPDLESAAGAGLESLKAWLLSLVDAVPEGIRSILVHSVEGIFSNGSALVEGISSGLLSLAGSLLRSVPDSALGLGTWILACFMISTRLPQIRHWLRQHIPPTWRDRYSPHLQTLKKTLLGWLLAQTKLVGITFVILCLGFLLLQITHPILWAAITCLVDILPVLGTGTILIPWSVICFLQGNTLQAVGLLAIYTVIAVLRSVLEPRFVGKELGLDPLVTLIAIYVGYRIWGLLGMLLAPILAVIVTQFFLQTKK